MPCECDGGERRRRATPVRRLVRAALWALPAPVAAPVGTAWCGAGAVPAIADRAGLCSPAAAPSQKRPAQLPPAAVPSNEETKCTADPDKFCSLCHATFNNPLMAKQHYTGKKHRKQETKLKLMAHYGRTPDAPAATSAGESLPAAPVPGGGGDLWAGWGQQGLEKDLPCTGSRIAWWFH